MEKGDKLENKIIPPETNKVASGKVRIVYIGDRPEVCAVVGGARNIVFKRGVPVEIGRRLVEGLLRQPDKFKEVE